MTEKLDAETRLLAAIAYGESSTADVFEEMAAIANVMVRQSKARGYSTISGFTAKEKSFSFVVTDGNKRYKELYTAKEGGNRKIAADVRCCEGRKECVVRWGGLFKWRIFLGWCGYKVELQESFQGWARDKVH